MTSTSVSISVSHFLYILRLLRLLRDMYNCRLLPRSSMLERDLAIGSVSVCLSVRLSVTRWYGIDSKLMTV